MQKNEFIVVYDPGTQFSKFRRGGLDIYTSSKESLWTILKRRADEGYPRAYYNGFVCVIGRKQI